MKEMLILLMALMLLKPGYSQENCRFCRSVEKGKLKKTERLIKHEVRKRKSGVTFDNGPGSGLLVSHVQGLDSIVLWLQRKPCIEDATWDKCEVKPAIYPGWSTIGVRFITNAGIVEKCFLIQEGTTGTLHIFGWKPHVFRTKNKLIYKKMSDCAGFIEIQKGRCQKFDQQH